MPPSIDEGTVWGMRRTPLLLLLTGYAGLDTQPPDARERLDTFVESTQCDPSSIEEIERTGSSTTYTCRDEADSVTYTLLVADDVDVLAEGLGNPSGQRVQGIDYVLHVDAAGEVPLLPERLGQRG